MKRIFYLAYLLLLALAVNADDRSMSDMQAIAAQKLYGAQARGNSPSTSLNLLVDDPAYCVFGADGDGFVIVSRDDMFEPVLAYSSKPFPTNHIPCGMKWWMEVTSENMQAMKAAGITPSKAPHRAISAQSNFLPAEWGQDAPYNYYTPLVENTKTPTGCVATALAQVLYYYRYPTQGTGEGWYRLGSSNYQNPVTINTVYAWDLMQDCYTEPIAFLSQEKKDAIGKLMFECGACARMDYDKDGSGAYTFGLLASVPENFQYDPLAIQFFDRDFFTDEEWLNLVWTELENRRPILYGGLDVLSGGHAFVFSGVDQDGNVYVNWGWNGDANGFFSLKDLCPSGILGSPITTTYHFNNGQSMLYGFRTDPNPTPDEQYRSYLYADDDYKIAASIDPCAVQHTLGIVRNRRPYQYNGSIGIYFENENDPSQNYFYELYEGEVEKADVAQGLIYGVSMSSTSVFSISLSSLQPGTYKAYAASKDDKDVKPQLIRVQGVGPRTFTVTIADDKTVTVSEPQITTAINAVTVTKPASFDNYWYTINGQRLNGEPTQRGIYIHDGRKVVK